MTESFPNQPRSEPETGTILFRCPQRLIRRLEMVSAQRGQNVSEYLVELLENTLSLDTSGETAFAPGSGQESTHPLVSMIHENHVEFSDPHRGYNFFAQHLPDVLDKMQLTAVLMRKTDLNEHVIEDLLNSLLPKPFDPLALQTVLDIYQVAAGKLDEQIREAERIKRSEIVNKVTRSA